MAAVTICSDFGAQKNKVWHCFPIHFPWSDGIGYDDLRFLSDKIDFEIKAVKRDKEGHYIMIKGSIQEDITIINTYAPNIGAPQYVRQMLTNMKGKINSNTIIVGDFNTPLTPMDRSTKQKINKETQTLNDTIDHLDLMISIGKFTLKQWISAFSQVHTEPSPG